MLRNSDENCSRTNLRSTSWWGSPAILTQILVMCLQSWLPGPRLLGSCQERAGGQRLRMMKWMTLSQVSGLHRQSTEELSKNTAVCVLGEVMSRADKWLFSSTLKNSMFVRTPELILKKRSFSCFNCAWFFKGKVVITYQSLLNIHYAILLQNFQTQIITLANKSLVCDEIRLAVKENAGRRIQEKEMPFYMSII